MIGYQVKKIRKKPKNDNVHYVDNQHFLALMIDFINSRKPHLHHVKSGVMSVNELAPIPDEIGLMIYKIANKLSNSPKFANYVFKDEMISDGIENCIQYIDNFDPEKSNNPFAYFTQIIYWAFVRRIKKEKQYLYIKYKSIERSLGENEGLDGEVSGTNAYGSQYADMNMREYIEQFEQKQFTKKEKPVSKKKLID